MRAFWMVALAVVVAAHASAQLGLPTDGVVADLEDGLGGVDEALGPLDPVTDPVDDILGPVTGTSSPSPSSSSSPTASATTSPSPTASGSASPTASASPSGPPAVAPDGSGGEAGGSAGGPAGPDQAGAAGEGGENAPLSADGEDDESGGALPTAERLTGASLFLACTLLAVLAMPRRRLL